MQTMKQDIARAGAWWDNVSQLATDRKALRSLTAKCIDGAGKDARRLFYNLGSAMAQLQSSNWLCDLLITHAETV